VEHFSKSIRFTMKFRSFPYGTDSPYDMFTRAREYRLEPDVIKQIQCPMLITDPEGEQFWPGQSQELYEALESPKELVKFTAEEGAERRGGRRASFASRWPAACAPSGFSTGSTARSPRTDPTGGSSSSTTTSSSAHRASGSCARPA
jgi:hypothetical protein